MISIYNKTFSLLRIRIEDKLFEDKTLLRHVALYMWLAWTLVTGKRNKNFVGFGNKIYILCCDRDIFAKHINLFLVFPKFSLKDWEYHMNGIECFFMQALTEDMLKKTPVIFVMQTSWSPTKSLARYCSWVRSHTSIDTGHGMNGLRVALWRKTWRYR